MKNALARSPWLAYFACTDFDYHYGEEDGVEAEFERKLGDDNKVLIGLTVFYRGPVVVADWRVQVSQRNSGTQEYKPVYEAKAPSPFTLAAGDGAMVTRFIVPIFQSVVDGLSEGGTRVTGLMGDDLRGIRQPLLYRLLPVAIADMVLST